MPTTPLEYINSQIQPLAIGVQISLDAHNFIIVILKNRYAPQYRILTKEFCFISTHICHTKKSPG